ncbi:histidine kinase dimerization/phosphoacceptor domain -containing protein [Mucilaginibacter angelicae]|uniref:histidine kinase n=1 Tax=Mucilaginibacter angelicae TaxID=869718 RepID=A0ABV6L362_9SPHI
MQYSLQDLRDLLAKAKNSEQKAIALSRLSNFYVYNKIRSAGNLDSALHFARAAVAQLKQADGASYEDAVTALGNACIRTGLTREALNLYDRSTGRLRIRLAVRIGKFYLYRPGEFKSDLDSAEFFINDAVRESRKLGDNYLENNAAYYLCDVSSERGDISKSHAGFLSLADHCVRTGDFQNAGECYSRLGDHANFTDTTGKLKNYRQAGRLFAKGHLTELEINIRKAIADVHFRAGKLDLAEKELASVLNWYTSNKYKGVQDVYFLYSMLYRFKGNLEKALDYGLRAVECANQTGSDQSISYYYNALAQICNDLGKESESISWYRKTLDLLHQENSDLMYNSLKDLSDYYIKRGQAGDILAQLEAADNRNKLTALDKELIAAIRGNCYLSQKNYSKAEHYYLEMIRWESAARIHTYNSADSYFTIANFYLAREKFRDAEYYLNKVLSLPPSTYPPSRIKEVYLKLSAADSAKGDFRAAYRHYKQYKTLNDSLFTEDKSKQIQELLIKYDTKQTENENQLLKKESQIQKNQLQRAQLYTRITIAGIAALLLIVFLLYVYLRYRRKSERTFKLQEQEIRKQNISLENLIGKQAKLISDKERLIKEIHHRVKNNLQVVMSLLNTQMHHIQNEEVVNALKDSQNRLYSISLIHQKLFQNDNVSLVEIRPYIIDLMKYLCDTFHFSQEITFDIQVDELYININQAIPLGLILNEAITNIIKYAFPGNRPGKVTVIFHVREDGNYELRIADNGLGLPSGFEFSSSNTLGMVLMHGLSEQLGGDLKIYDDHGVVISAVFPRRSDEEHDDGIPDTEPV